MDSPEQCKTLYHSTTDEAYQQIIDEGVLYGIDYIYLPAEHRQMTLTPDKQASLDYGIYKGFRKRQSVMTLKFEVPQELIMSTGNMEGYNAIEYSAGELTSAQALPENYLNRIGMTRESALIEEQNGHVRFYALKLEGYLADVEPLTRFNFHEIFRGLPEA